MFYSFVADEGQSELLRAPFLKVTNISRLQRAKSAASEGRIQKCI